MVKLDKLVLEKKVCDSDSTEVDLSNNGIDSIDQNTFEKCSKLLVINLRSNQIESINQQIFRGLNNLTVLDLSYNKFQSFDLIILKHPAKLKILNLSNNQISSFIVNYSSDFKSLDLEELYLQNNKLISIVKSDFNLRCLPGLKKLDLTGNRLDKFSAVLLKPAKNLETLKIDLSRLKSFDYESLPIKYLVS